MIWLALFGWLVIAILWATYAPLPPANTWRSKIEVVICLPLVALLWIGFAIICFIAVNRRE